MNHERNALHLQSAQCTCLESNAAANYVCYCVRKLCAIVE
jgi:hypothetical protein